jgi:hypothetical protein
MSEITRFDIDLCGSGTYKQDHPNGLCVLYVDHLKAVEDAVKAEREACLNLVQVELAACDLGSEERAACTFIGMAIQARGEK